MVLATRNQENVALTRRLFGWFAARDMDSLAAVLAEQVCARPSVGGAPVLRGRDEVVRWWGEFASRDDDLEVRPLEFQAHGDCVIVRGYLRHQAGRSLAESQVYWLFEIQNGQITRMESHPSRDAALRSASAPDPALR